MEKDRLDEKKVLPKSLNTRNCEKSATPSKKEATNM